VPATILYGQGFRILTTDAGSIAKVSLIRLTKDATGLTVAAPSSGNTAPPGYYMLFIVNATDVPSVARIVKIY
jgi:galactose oxidase